MDPTYIHQPVPKGGSKDGHDGGAGMAANIAITPNRVVIVADDRNGFRGP